MNTRARNRRAAFLVALVWLVMILLAGGFWVSILYIAGKLLGLV